MVKVEKVAVEIVWWRQWPMMEVEKVVDWTDRLVVVIAEIIIEIHMRCRWRVELNEVGGGQARRVCVCVNR